MKIVKGVLTYTLILIGVLLIAGILLFAGMAFLGFSVFGYRVTISTNKPTTAHTVLLEINDTKTVDGEDIEFNIERTIEINSNNYDVIIFPFEIENAKYNMKAEIRYADCALGLVSNGDLLNKTTRSSFEILYYDADGNLCTTEEEQKVAPKWVINLTTPQGVLNYRDSFISIQLPVSKTSGELEYNFVINSGKGDVLIKPVTNSQTKEEEMGILKVNGLEIQTTTGSYNSYGLKETSGRIELNYLNLKTEKGTFNFNKQNVLSVANVKIESSMGNFNFKDFCGGFTIKGENLVFNAESIDTTGKSFLYNCPHGTLKLGTLNVGDQVGEIVTEYAKVEIENVIGDLAIQATYGDTHLGKTSSNVIDVTTTHGDITIDEVTTGMDYFYGKVAARSTYGDIKVSYAADGWFTNKKGQIDVTFVGTASKYKTRIETVDGLAVAKGLRGAVDATVTGDANLKLTFAHIPQGTHQQSNISITSGHLTLTVPQIVSGQSNGFILTGSLSGGAKIEVTNANSLDNIYSTLEEDIKDYEATNDYKFNLTSTGGKISIILP